MRTFVVCLFMLLTVVGSAHAEGSAPAPAKQIAIKVELYAMAPADAVAAHLEQPFVLENMNPFNQRFSAVPTAPTATIALDELQVAQKARLLMNTEFPCVTGHAGSVSGLALLPVNSTMPAVTETSPAEELQFPGMMGYMARFTPTVDDKGRITLECYTQLRAPGIQQPGLPSAASSQSMKTTMRLNEGSTIVIANFVPQNVRDALRLAGYGADTVPGRALVSDTLPADAQIYLLITPTIIDN